MFTGIPDTDRLVLLYLDDESFTALSSVSTYIHSLYTETLWADRFALKYGGTLWQYGLSHRDVYIEFSKLQEEALLKRVVDKGFINILEKMIKTINITILNKLLRWTSKNGYLEVVKLLLDRGADVHTKDDVCLQWVSKGGYLEVAKLLLDRGADIHANDDNALHLACQYGYLEIVKLLLDRGADIHADNDSALHLASQYGHLEIVKLLKRTWRENL